MLKPIVTQLLRRMSYVAQRVVFLTDKLITSKSEQENTFMKKAVNNAARRFIELLINSCTQRCEEEFRCTHLIFFEAKNNPKYAKEGNFTLESIGATASQILLDLRERITENVMLKVYQFFLEPLYISHPLYSPSFIPHNILF